MGALLLTPHKGKRVGAFTSGAVVLQWVLPTPFSEGNRGPERLGEPLQLEQPRVMAPGPEPTWSTPPSGPHLACGPRGAWGTELSAEHWPPELSARMRNYRASSVPPAPAHGSGTNDRSFPNTGRPRLTGLGLSQKLRHWQVQAPCAHTCHQRGAGTLASVWGEECCPTRANTRTQTPSGGVSVGLRAALRVLKTPQKPSFRLQKRLGSVA